jgi:hypothetical protein
MKTLLTIVLATLSVAFLFVGCSEQPNKEKQVIEATYNYLISKAEQLQNNDAQIQKVTIRHRFESALIESLREIALGTMDIGESINVNLSYGSNLSTYGVPTSTNALKKLVIYDKDSFWLVSIGDWEWRFSEKTGEVTAQNDEAAKLLDSITLRTYYNSKYGYSINYPPDWNVLDVVKEAVSISYVSSDGTMETAIFLNCLPKIPNLGLRDYAEKRVSSFQPDSYKIATAEGNQNISGLVADIVGLRFENLAVLGNNINYDAKWYFFDKDDRYFEILTVARPTAFENLSNMFDPYLSLKFLP